MSAKHQAWRKHLDQKTDVALTMVMVNMRVKTTQRVKWRRQMPPSKPPMPWNPPHSWAWEGKSDEQTSALQIHLPIPGSNGCWQNPSVLFPWEMLLKFCLVELPIRLHERPPLRRLILKPASLVNTALLCEMLTITAALCSVSFG